MFALNEQKAVQNVNCNSKPVNRETDFEYRVYRTKAFIECRLNNMQPLGLDNLWRFAMLPEQ